MAEALLSLQDIRVRYDASVVLQFSSLAVHAGEVLAVIGPNGAGKSTLLRLMGLLQQPTEGKVYFHGKEVNHNDGLAIRRRMATVFQEPLLLNASVYDNTALGLKLRGLNRSAIEERVRPWLEHLSIAHLARRKARSLSGGEAQRTSLARAFALDPELLLLDEPFSALDPPTREGLLMDLETILRKAAVTTVFVTHDRDEALMIADRVAVLIEGRLLQVGATAEVFAHPVTEGVAQFVGVDTRIAAVVESVAQGLAQVAFNGGKAEVKGDLQPGEEVLLCLRPEDICLSLPALEDLTRRNRVRCKIGKITPWGSQYRVDLECVGSRLVALVPRPSFVELGIREGDVVVASFNTAAAHVIRRG
jgi:tungstate transport system ATP-binding protein